MSVPAPTEPSRLAVTDLADGRAVATYLFEHLTDRVRPDALADARALADDALSFSHPPAGAHVLAARLAEWAGDSARFVDHTRRALAVDRRFGPALDDQAYLDLLHRGAGRKARPVRHAEVLFAKADHWTGRPPQLADQLDLAARVLGVDDVRRHGTVALAVAELWQFVGFLLFEGGLLGRFEATCGPLLPPAERALLAGWHGVRHRLVRLDAHDSRSWRFTDSISGEVLDAEVLHPHEAWPVGREAVAVLAPAGGSLVLVGQPVLVAGETLDAVREAWARRDEDPWAVAVRVLLLCSGAVLEAVIEEQDERIRFVLPDVDPDEIDLSEEGLLEHFRDASPGLAARADAGDHTAEVALLLDAIVAHRIVTLRVPHTWAMAQRLLDAGGSRESVLEAVRHATHLELWSRAQRE